jgi:putative spermidine/putrescine transport system ATP-binding protein
MSYLSLRQLVKQYGGAGARAVDGVSLDIEKGEFVTFLGPSGSGKTTTLMMIAGFETPTAGEIALANRAIDPVPPHKRNIGMVFQNYALFPHMSVARNVAFPLRMRSVGKQEIAERVARMLAIVGLSQFGDALPRQLSGGQQQRVALARALVFSPDVLLLDEPLGALDKNLREQMQIEIRRIHNELNITTVYVTHDQTEAMTMSDRIAVFNAGRIEQVAPPLTIYRAPATEFVANFVGDNNVLDAVVLDDGRLELTAVGVVEAGAPANGRRQIKVAIRPEAIGHSEAGFPFTVKGIVNYGDNVLLVGAVGAVEMKIRMSSVAAERIAVGHTFNIGWPPSAICVIAG